MICQTCGAEVDNDLIFCTSCGNRLGTTSSHQMQTVSMNDSVTTKTSALNPQPSSGSGLKWVALIVALIIIPVSLFIVYLLLSNSRSGRRDFGNRNLSQPANNSYAGNDVFNSNAAPANLNSALNTNLTPRGGTREPVFSERIEIAPGEHIAYPFKLDADAKIIGEGVISEGEQVEGYVYFQESYDQHFPDPTYKVFSMDGKTLKCEQTLVKGDYVLAFINKSKKPAVIQGIFYTSR